MLAIGSPTTQKLPGMVSNFTFLINNWLFDNLYLWGTIKVSKEEHKNTHTQQKHNKTKHNNKHNTKTQIKLPTKQKKRSEQEDEV